MVELPPLRWPVPRRSLAVWAAYHALRWAPVAVVSAIAYWAFPLPGRLATPVVHVGEKSPNDSTEREKEEGHQ